MTTIIDLLQSRIAILLQVSQGLCVLRFEDRNARIDGIINDHIASPFSMLLIGVHHISSACKNAREKDCDTALQQIDDRMYAKEYEDDNDQIFCYGISFFKKRCMVKEKG